MDNTQAPATDQFTFPDPEQFSFERARLARRRRIAQQLLQTPIEPEPGRMFGSLYSAPNPVGYFLKAADRWSANTDLDRTDQEEAALARREAEMSRNMLSSIPARTARTLGSDLSQGPSMEVVDNSEARQNAQVEAMRHPSIRESIKAQMLMDENQAKRLEASEQAAANRAFREAEDSKYKRTLAEAMQLKQQPSTVIHQGGAGKDAEDIALDRQLKQARIDALKNPKPVAAERKAALAQDELLGKIDNALAELKNNPNAVGWRTLTPNIALQRFDPEGVAARAALSELGAEKAHELYGAAFTAAERQRADQFIPAAGDTIETVRVKLANMRKLAAAARARASGGQQAATPASGESALPTKTINGKTYEKRADGWYEVQK